MHCCQVRWITFQCTIWLAATHRSRALSLTLGGQECLIQLTTHLDHLSAHHVVQHTNLTEQYRARAVNVSEGGEDDKHPNEGREALGRVGEEGSRTSEGHAQEGFVPCMLPSQLDHLSACSHPTAAGHFHRH